MQPAALSERSENGSEDAGRAKRLANLKPFKKGESGNPGGKWKGQDEFRELARQRSRKAFERIVELIDSSDERVAFMASKEVLDRAYGKPTGADDERNDKAITINIVRYAERDHAPEQLATEAVSVRTLELSRAGR